jgi:hypothetical protein
MNATASSVYRRVSVVWSTGASTVSVSRMSGNSRYSPLLDPAPMSFE